MRFMETHSDFHHGLLGEDLPDAASEELGEQALRRVGEFGQWKGRG